MLFMVVDFPAPLRPSRPTISPLRSDSVITSYSIHYTKLYETEITKGQLLALHLGRRKDAGNYTFAQVSMAKMNNVRIALEIARTARAVLGANGIMGEYPIMRHAANLESVV